MRRAPHAALPADNLPADKAAEQIKYQTTYRLLIRTIM
jgi:hypothetical protein